MPRSPIHLGEDQLIHVKNAIETSRDVDDNGIVSYLTALDIVLAFVDGAE